MAPILKALAGAPIVSDTAPADGLRVQRKPACHAKYPPVPSIRENLLLRPCKSGDTQTHDEEIDLQRKSLQRKPPKSSCRSSIALGGDGCPAIGLRCPALCIARDTRLQP